VVASAFDLLFAFDEVISLGHKENVTVVQVRGPAMVRQANFAGENGWAGVWVRRRSCGADCMPIGVR
jgi:hypothetical protein